MRSVLADGSSPGCRSRIPTLRPGALALNSSRFVPANKRKQSLLCTNPDPRPLTDGMVGQGTPEPLWKH